MTLKAFFHSSASDGSNAGSRAYSTSMENRPSASFRDHFFGLLIFALAFLFYAGNSVQPTIFDDNEGLYAGAVREMRAENAWLVPTNDGLPRIQKPPLTYWAMLASVRTFGLSEWSVRLPNALFTAAWIYATFLIGLRLRDAALGALAAAILGTMIGVFVFTHLIQPEPFLATFISLTIYSILGALDNPKHQRAWYLAAWIFMALASLSKALHGAAWPIGVVVVTMILIPRLRSPLLGFFHWSGPLLFLALFLPWYLCVEWRLPGFIHSHFVREQISAAVDTHFDRETLSIPIPTFILQHLIFFAPWILFAPAAITAWWQIKRQNTVATNSARSIIWIWGGVTFVTLLFTNLQDYYAMTCWGVAALWLSAALHPSLNPPRCLIGLPGVILSCAGATLLIFSFCFSSVLAHGSLQIAPVAERDTFANALSGISLGVWQSFLPLMQVAGAALLFGGIISSWFLWRRYPLRAPAIIALVVMMMTLCSLATDGFRIMSPNFSLAVVAKAINTAAHPDSVTACESAPHQSSSLLFYLNNRIHWVNAPSQREFAVRVLGQGKDLYFDTDQLVSEWDSSRQVFLIVEDKRLPDWQETLSHTSHTPRLLIHSGTRNVLVND